MKRRSRRVSISLFDEIAAGSAFWRRTPQIHESDSVTVPLTVGFLKPVVVLPADWRDWESWKLRAVLFHELTHVRRCDWPIAATAAFARCVFWFNPLAWWIERRLSTLAEEASDEASVRWTGDAASYAEALLQFAAAAKYGHRLIGGVAMARHRIGSRIQRVLALRRPGCGVLSRSGWVLLIVLAIPVLYGSAAVQMSAEPQTTALSPAEILRAVQSPMERAARAVVPASLATSAAPKPLLIAEAAPTQGTPQTPQSQPQAFPPVAVNPDLPGAIQLILAPVNTEVGRGNGQIQIQTRSGTNRYTGTAVWNFRNPAQATNTFGFVLTGVEGRTVSFADNKGGTFSYGCADCPFVVWESGVADAATNPGPGITFKLSADGNSLNATCRAVECSMSKVRAGSTAFGPVIRNKTFFFQLWDQQVSATNATIANVQLAPFEGATKVLSNAASVTLTVVQPPNPNSNPPTAGLRCFSVFGNVKADGTPFTAADCPGGLAVTIDEVFYFSVTK